MEDNHQDDVGASKTTLLFENPCNIIPHYRKSEKGRNLQAKHILREVEQKESYISTARPAKRKQNKNSKIFRYGLFHFENRYFLESFMRRMSSEMIIDKRKAITLKA